MDPHERLVDDVQPAFGQQAVDICNPPICRVLDRQHSQIGRARGDGGKDVFEIGAGQGLVIGAGIVTGFV